MRNQQESPGASGEVRAESPNTATQQSATGSDVARPLPAATEPGTARTPRRGWLGQYRSGMPVSPWELMRSMSEEIDRLIDGLSSRSTALGTTTRGTRPASDFGSYFTAAWTPPVEVIQKPNAIVFRAELPGLKADEVNVSVNDGLLTISGERKQEHEEKRDGFLRSERSYGTFYRAFSLPEAADEDKVVASFKNGVLEINVPVSERERGRRIKVDT
jgi:HSP20 family protein